MDQAFGFLSLPFLSISLFLIFSSLRNVVPLLGRKYISMFFLGMHVFVSPFAVHHDARPSVPTRRLNLKPVSCRVMRKQTRADFSMSELKPNHPSPPSPQTLGTETLAEFKHHALTCMLASRSSILEGALAPVARVRAFQLSFKSG